MKLPWTTFHLSKIEYPTSKHQKSIWNLLHKEKKPLGSICQPPQKNKTQKNNKPQNIETLRHISTGKESPIFFPSLSDFSLSNRQLQLLLFFQPHFYFQYSYFFPLGGKSRKKYLPKRKRPTAELGLKGLRRNGAFHFSETSMRKFLNCLGKTKSFLFYFFTNAL